MAGTITHEWNGTVLTITSDSGTSSCDLKGDTGDMGVRGAQGEPGITVTVPAEITTIEADVAAIRTELNEVKDSVAAADDIDAIEADIAALQTATKENADNISLILDNPSTEAVDSIKEFVDYMEEHGEVATSLQTQITENKEDIAAIETDLSTNYSKTALTVLKNELLDLVYPVGSIYISYVDKSPALFLGGSWLRLKDAFLIGAGGSYAVGATGGNTSMQLSAAIGAYNNDTSSIGYAATGPIPNMPYTYGGNISNQITNTSSINHSTVVYDWVQETTTPSLLPPYLAVYMWRRTY